MKFFATIEESSVLISLLSLVTLVVLPEYVNGLVAAPKPDIILLPPQPPLKYKIPPYTPRISANPTIQDIIHEVKELPSNKEARQITKKYGLDILTVTWEDTGRSFMSSVGPNISDMTIRVLDEPMPVIRNPNFSDVTFEYEMSRIPIVVGNEKDGSTKTVPLDEYLKEIYKYTELPFGTNLYESSRDKKVLVSTQACLLPVGKLSYNAHNKPEPSEFYVQIYNYQSNPEDPAVLYILATSKGTSPQLPTTHGYEHQKLYFNDKGLKRALTAQRLSQHRMDQGKTDLKAPKTEEESKENSVFVIQVPLKHKERPRPAMPEFYAFGNSPNAGLGGKGVAFKMMRSLNSHKVVDVDDAIVDLSKKDFGPFPKISRKLERDTRFPVRATIQFYKATSNGAVNDDVIKTIYDSMEKARLMGDYYGSLVTDSEARKHRVTSADTSGYYRFY